MSKEAPPTTKKAFRFTVASDVDLLKEAKLVSPHDCPYGQTAKRWEEVAEHMRAIHGDLVTIVGCRRRFDDLLTAFKNDTVNALRASGTEEDVKKRDELLHDIADLMDVRAKKKKGAKEDKVESDGHRMRAAALKRKTTDGDDPEGSESAESKKNKNEGFGSIKDVASVVADFTSMMESFNKLREAEISAKKEELAVAQRRLELDQQRFLLEKAEREARFQLERWEREIQLESMRSNIELMRSLKNKL